MTYKIIALSKSASDLSGLKFGNLFVVAPIKRKNKRIMWLCVCRCGSEVVVNANNIKKAKSCGCGRSKYPAGLYGSSEYQAWASAIQRCTNPNNPRYKNYGGRGISVCLEWLHGFQSFIDDMGIKKSPKLTLERVNNDGDYSPENCIWADWDTQYKNRRSRKAAEYYA